VIETTQPSSSAASIDVVPALNVALNSSSCAPIPRDRLVLLAAHRRVGRRAGDGPLGQQSGERIGAALERERIARPDARDLLRSQSIDA
jgi:hypothetical protein